MLFNSYIFILLFLPLVLVGYYGLYRLKNATYSKVFLLGMSLWFYAYFNINYLFIILGSIILNYIFSQILGKCELKPMYRKGIMIGAIGANVAIIFYYKYFDFFISNMNSCFQLDWQLKNLVLPLGISFFTFQQISYIVDSYRYETKDYSLLDYALFVTFFPQLVAGPIVLHNEMIPQFKDERNYVLNWDNLSKGIHIFVMGLTKKVLIADVLGKAVNWGYTTDTVLTSMEVLIISVSYTLQIYFDFSGYCDMAMGLGKMLNIDIPQNFDSPYKATSIPDFWKRWHKTLTRFLTHYIYIPLGGNRKGKVRQYINIFIVFLISGIWHGANWTFIIWGILHGVFNIVNRIFMKTWERLHIVTRWLFTFLFVNITWIIFRADTVSQAFMMIRRLLGCENQSISLELPSVYKGVEFEFLEDILHLPSLDSIVPPFYMMLYIFGGILICLNCKNNQEREFKPTAVSAVSTIFLFVYCIFSLAGVSTFLYFNF